MGKSLGGDEGGEQQSKCIVRRKICAQLKIHDMTEDYKLNTCPLINNPASPLMGIAKGERVQSKLSQRRSQLYQ